MTEFERGLPDTETAWHEEREKREEEQKRRAAAWLALVEKFKRGKQQESVEQARQRLEEAEKKRGGNLHLSPDVLHQRANKPYWEKTPDDWGASLDLEFGYNHEGDLYTRNAQGQVAFHRVYEFFVEDTPPGQEPMLYNGGYPFPLRQRTNFLTYYAANAGFTQVGAPTRLPKTALLDKTADGQTTFINTNTPELATSQARWLSTMRYVFTYPQGVAPRPSPYARLHHALPAEALGQKRFCQAVYEQPQKAQTSYRRRASRS